MAQGYEIKLPGRQFLEFAMNKLRMLCAIFALASNTLHAQSSVPLPSSPPGTRAHLLEACSQDSQSFFGGYCVGVARALGEDAIFHATWKSADPAACMAETRNITVSLMVQVMVKALRDAPEMLSLPTTPSVKNDITAYAQKLCPPRN